MGRFKHFFYGLIPGLIIPIAFTWIYINRFFSSEANFMDVIELLNRTGLLSKTLLLSAMPNLIIVYIFYKLDKFDIAKGLILGAMPYFISSIFMS
jgi:hypothetical protein